MCLVNNTPKSFVDLYVIKSLDHFLILCYRRVHHRLKKWVIFFCRMTSVMPIEFRSF